MADKPADKADKFYKISSTKDLYIGAHTITRSEYYRRTENAKRPMFDDGIQKRNKTTTRA